MPRSARRANLAALSLCALVATAGAWAGESLDLAGAYARAAEYLPWRIEKWMARHHTYDVRWSADGQQAAFESRGPDANGWMVLDVASRTVRLEKEAPSFATSPVRQVNLSPDGRWGVGVEGFNLWLVGSGSGSKHPLTRDGSAEAAYSASYSFGLIGYEEHHAQRGPMRPAIGLWSPDGRRFISYQYDQRSLKPQHYWYAVTGEGYGKRPEVIPQLAPYAEEGDPFAQLVMVDVQAGTAAPIKGATLGTYFDPVYANVIQWSADGRFCYILREGPAFRQVAIQRLDVASGELEEVYRQESDTYVLLSGSRYPAIWPLLRGGRTAVWFSEHTGWGNLYLLDLERGKLGRALTTGRRVVKSVLRVDEAKGWVYFIASGSDERMDPYHNQLFRARLDGGGVQKLTPEPADHIVSLSPDGRVFLDTQVEGVASAPRTLLRSLEGGAVIAKIAAVDFAPLRARRWHAAERVRVRDADDLYDVYLTLNKPSDFDPKRRYPVLDYVYGPPNQYQAAPSFPVGPDWDVGMEFWHAQAIAELGFIVAIIDAPGTPSRGYEFARASYGEKSYDVGMRHHIAALRQLAANDPSLDLERVGVFGNSGGGYASARAMLLYPEFFKVGVSGAGVHDIGRAQTGSWAGRYMGPYSENRELYDRLSNTSLASRLQGKLLLMHGEADAEVSISATQQFAHALIEANRDFDLLYIPNMTHYTSRNPYFVRRRWDYFVRHLLDAAPPQDFRVPAP
jgi:dipeptidyl-peptidase-4